MKQNQLSKYVLVLCALAFAALCANPMWAQSDEKEKPAVYTYVAEWATPRGDWPAIEKGNAASKQIMDKLMADGTIVSYGWFKSLVHHEGQPTHGDWFSATSMANLMKALSATWGNAGGPPETGKAEENSKHWDYVLVSHEYNGRPGTYENAYLRVATFKQKEGQGETLRRTIKSYIVPTLEKLLADGSIQSYSIDWEAVHTEPAGVFDIVILTKAADGLDKFDAALEAAGKANPTGGPAFASAVDYSEHRDSLDLVTVSSK
jgi:hypothetical protein